MLDEKKMRDADMQKAKQLADINADQITVGSDIDESKVVPSDN